ncbi:hypothetical protein [Candidatus Manganitrophus noduliformans]|uniref:Uncharacterized protein n=1 Tax=Candidatus Manganitrophus noduliformans TaxID=2606439 RepID=A0A7X6I8Z4_9BACT|nr:hypothetical protein [Candidatus Manganitrophus noduliformans]NKE69146.1 hypothetical protein [Candidatus Manganitrophus noduliformans]
MKMVPPTSSENEESLFLSADRPNGSEERNKKLRETSIGLLRSIRPVRDAPSLRMERAVFPMAWR